MSTLVAARPAGLGGMLRSEWTKLRSVRSTTWSIAAMAAVSIGLTSLIGFFMMRDWAEMEADDRAFFTADPLEVILVQPVMISQLIVAVLGVMVISAEYTTGMIRSTLQAQPRRMTVLTAKIAVFAVLMLLIGEAVSFGAFFVGDAILSENIPVSLDDPGVLRSVAGAGVFLAVLGLFSLAFGAIIRHTAGAITAVLGLVLIASPLTTLLPGTWGDYVYAYMPTNAGSLILEPVLPPDPLLTQWQGLGVFAGWTVLLLAVAAYLFKRRDA